MQCHDHFDSTYQGSEVVTLMDVLEFVDHGSNSFLASLTNSLTNFHATFQLDLTDGNQFIFSQCLYFL